METFLTNYLQPADDFVKRPPLDRKVAKQLAAIAMLTVIVTFGAIALFSFDQAHETHTIRSPPCDIPDGDCQDVTVYPKTLTVKLNAYASIEVILTGRLNGSQVREAIRGMSCQLVGSDGPLVFSTKSANTPFDFRRSCTNSAIPGITLKTLGRDLNHEYQFEVLQALTKMKAEQAQNYDSNLLSFTIQKSHVRYPRNKSERVWLGIVVHEFAFADGKRYNFVYSVPCALPSHEGELSTVRDCHLGAPYLDSPNHHSLSSQDLCPPLDQSDAIAAAKQVYREVVHHPSWAAHRLGKDRNMSVSYHLARAICSGEALSIVEFLEEKEALRPQSQRSADEIIELIIQTIGKQCPYSFECNQRSFQNMLVWLSFAYPLSLIAVKLLILLVRPAYRLLNKIEHLGHAKPQDDMAERMEDSVSVDAMANGGSLEADGLCSQAGKRAGVNEPIDIRMAELEKRIAQVERSARNWPEQSEPSVGNLQGVTTETDRDCFPQLQASGDPAAEHALRLAQDLQSTVADLQKKVSVLSAGKQDPHTSLQNFEDRLSHVNTKPLLDVPSSKIQQSNEQIHPELSIRVTMLDSTVWQLRQEMGLFDWNSTRMRTMEDMQTKIDSTLWQLREEMGSFDWKLGHIEHELILAGVLGATIPKRLGATSVGDIDSDVVAKRQADLTKEDGKRQNSTTERPSSDRTLDGVEN